MLTCDAAAGAQHFNVEHLMYFHHQTATAAAGARIYRICSMLWFQGSAGVVYVGAVSSVQCAAVCCVLCGVGCQIDSRVAGALSFWSFVSLSEIVNGIYAVTKDAITELSCTSSA